MLTPVDHVSRSPNDTYYVDHDTVLRCHTSAHQAGRFHRPSHNPWTLSAQSTAGDCSDAFVLAMRESLTMSVR